MADLRNVEIDDTGFITLPAGGTAQRPSSPQSGMLRFNTDLGEPELYSGTAWTPYGPPPVWQTKPSTITIGDRYTPSPAITLNAVDPLGSLVTYAVDSGSLPPGLNLNSSTGEITGSVSDVTADEQYDFTVKASSDYGDTELNLTILVKFVRDGTTKARFNASAFSIVQAIAEVGGSYSDWSQLTGALWIDPQFFARTSDQNIPIQVFCDMETQGGGWTLAIKWDQNQSDTSNYSLERDGGREYVSSDQMNNLQPQGARYASIDMRDIIFHDNQYENGGRYMMHATTSATSATSPSQYTGHDFTQEVSAADVSVSGGTTTSFSPIFSSFYFDVTDDPTDLWNTTASWITNSGESHSSASYSMNNTADREQYGQGVFYALGMDPLNPNEQVDRYGGYENHNDTSSRSYAPLPTTNDGRSHFSNTGREGSVYCSGSTVDLGGHTDPKFNWGWFSQDGTQQNYGYGNYAIGTPCDNDTNDVPRHRMNYMFIR